ncbi:MAG: Ig-like domain-containing protein [Candidatus Omnitrophica bacterium]|nr:Ig-like domain-containing protein [Candidatus Omnitrophota bacterium]MBU4478259.1 Ig-like domain-containing protein [Candidatus Omnitrophota bacterium]MCG2703327.1 Ig-like domain-containing protein [Candidatus Omnitrophota bacterium]
MRILDCFLKGMLLLIAVVAAVLPAAAQENIPHISAVSPEFGAENVDTLTEISVTFSAAMDKKSVEKNFYVYPEVKGKFCWKENTLFFKPLEPLLPSTSYYVSCSPQIKSAGGTPLVITAFSTPAQALCVGADGKIIIVSINARVERMLVDGRNPVWSVDKRSIVYDWDGKLWQIDAAARDKIQLIDDDETYKSGRPAYNPVMDLVAFIGTNDAGADNVYTIEPQTKAVQQLTAFYEPMSIDFLRWSPDGLYLAFLRSGQIWIMNRDGKDMRKLTTTDLTCKSNFAWSPGGVKITFGGKENVWVGDIYSSELKKLSFDNPKTGALDWSQYNKVVFESDGLTIMDADGSNEIQVATAGGNPCWIDKGKYLSYVLPLYDKDNSAQLWIMSADGLTKEKIADIDSRYTSVSWSKSSNTQKLFSP